jgi:hypothetical protein
MARNATTSWLHGSTPSFSAIARYFALVPKTVIRSSSAIDQRLSCSGANAAPSYSTTVAPTASELTSQFHIIHPHVVK